MKNRKVLKIIFLIALIFCSTFAYVNYNNIDKSKQENKKLTSREAMIYVENIVKEKKPAPTESARVYAYAATAFYETLKETNNLEKAKATSNYFAEKLLNSTSTVNVESLLYLKVFKMLNERIENDGYKNTALGYDMPKGNNFWVDRDNNPKTPFTPTAGRWQRWSIDNFNYTVPVPPKYNSAEYIGALEKVREASENRTPEQGAAINFWGGVPGTVQPAGIWQEVFFEKSKKYNLSEEEYAYAQMTLAQTLADSFAECWKVKYMYWTKRPDMATGTIDVAMPNPPFPSYVSGHSTISAAAAIVLGELFPIDAEYYMKNAEEARDSRLWAGIHFEYDNKEGFELGIKIGGNIIKNKKLGPLI